MQSRSTITRGDRSTTVVSSGVPTYTINSVKAETETFSVSIDITNGNRKTPNPSAFTRTVQRNYRGSVLTTVGDSYSYQSVGCQPWTPSHLGSFSYLRTLAYNEALNRLLSQARGGFDGAIAIAEAGQTTKMVTAVGKLSAYVRSFKPRNWANKWLEYQYGWRPLVKDIYDLANEALHESRSKLVLISSAHSNEVLARVDPSITGATSRNTRYRRTSANFRCKFHCKFDIKPSVLSSIGNFTSLNPIGIAWELVPYSFVVDWVVDVGGYLRNFETAALVSSAFVNGYYTEGSLLETSESDLGLEKTGTRYDIWSVDGGMRSTTKNRQVLGGTPFPRPPPFHLSLGSTQLVSAGSLMSQHLR